MKQGMRRVITPLPQDLRNALPRTHRELTAAMIAERTPNIAKTDAAMSGRCSMPRPMSSETTALLRSQNELYVRQSHELAELLGFETRNKYGIYTSDQRQVGFVAEQSKGILGFLL